MVSKHTIRCIENNYGNTNFTVGKYYSLDKCRISTDWGLHIDPIIKELSDTVFEAALCVFEIVEVR